MRLLLFDLLIIFRSLFALFLNIFCWLLNLPGVVFEVHTIQKLIFKHAHFPLADNPLWHASKKYECNDDSSPRWRSWVSEKWKLEHLCEIRLNKLLSQHTKQAKQMFFLHLSKAADYSKVDFSINVYCVCAVTKYCCRYNFH